MMLRASVELSGETVDYRAVTDPTAATTSGIAAGEQLLAFAEAVVQGDDETLDRARGELIAAVGDEAFVDAAGVVGNFQRMVRIADSTGIPLDPPVILMTHDLRDDLGLGEYASAKNTREPSAASRAMGRVLRPLAGPIIRLIGRVYGR
jgi:hypothetical protein